MPTRIKLLAKQSGADLVGICDSHELRDNAEDLSLILPGHRAVVVIMIRHSAATLRSGNIRVAQLDTIYSYKLAIDVACRVARAIEDEGYNAVPIPPALPIDMSDERRGMVGDVDLRRAAVLAGLGVYGRSGLVVTREYGPRVRISGVVTDAPLKPDSGVRDFAKAMRDICGGCRRCIDACPSKAIIGDGVVDKNRCSKNLFRYGLRGLIKFLARLLEAEPGERDKLLRSYDLREIWQTLITGNYYYCWVCQAVCPVGLRR
jgi:epoxyqueuosine reductase QueG